MGAMKVIKSGVIKLGELEVEVHVLENGERIIDEQSVIEFITWLQLGKITPEQSDRFAKDLSEY